MNGSNRQLSPLRLKAVNKLKKRVKVRRSNFKDKITKMFFILLLWNWKSEDII